MDGPDLDTVRAAPMPGVDLSVLIVNWNVAPLLAECLQSIASETGRLKVETIVVDNASHDGSVAMLRQRFPGVRVIASESNLGFARANNLAIPRTHGRYVLLLNPDTRLQPGALEAMYAFLEARPSAGAVGPLLIGPDGRPQPVPSAHRLPTLSSALLCDTLRFQDLPLIGPRISRIFLSPYDLRINQEVEAISGACMMLRKEALDRLGGFGDCFLHCGEDLDLCFRLRRAGFSIHFLSEARVIHVWGQSVKQAPVRSTVNAALSIQHYFRRCYGPGSGLAYRALVQGIQVPVTMLAGVVKLLLGRESRRSFRQRLEFARSVLAWRSPAGP